MLVVYPLSLHLLSKIKSCEKQQLDFLLTAGAFGLVIANNASISGAEGGCQSRSWISTSAMSAALVLAAGGTPFQPAKQAVL